MEAPVRQSVWWGRKRAFPDEKSARYYIVGNNDVWMIQFKNADNGQYKSSYEATSFAIAAAQTLGTRGEHAHVCVFDDDGRLRCKWSPSSETSRTGARG
jgi:hypothetical protein